MADMETQIHESSPAQPSPWDMASDAPAPGQPAAEQSTDSDPVEDIVSGVDEFSRIFNEETQPQQEVAPEVAPETQQTAPQVAPVESQTGIAPQDNDQVRFQYWQSEADKMRNELVKEQARNEVLREQMQNGQQAPQQAEAQVEEFPPPPERPQKPQGYNREEAFTDSSSDSASYLDEVDSWREQMDDYNRLYAEYNVALVQEERDQINAKQQEQVQRQQQVQAVQKQMSDVQTYIKSTYSAPDEVVQDFIKKYSSQESVTLDNLWKLYQLEQGHNVGVNPSTVAQPSPAFQQTKRAQSVPTPMGVMPAANTATHKSDADSVMDELISDYKTKNPWT